MGVCEDLILYHDPKLFSRLKLPLSIGIVGESASGKSTITHDFIEVLNKFGITTTRINTDDYYYDHSNEVVECGSFAEWAKDKDLDCPEAMELSLMKKHIKELKHGHSVWLPKYDMSGTAIRIDEATWAEPSDIIISEGLFTMCVKDAFDIKIYVDIDKHVQKERWYTRAIERKLGSAMDIMYERANDRADTYIRPYKSICDVIISGEGPRPRYKDLMERILTKLVSIR